MVLSVVVSAFSLARLEDLINLLDGLCKQNYENIEIIIIIDESDELFNEVKQYISIKSICNMLVIFNKINMGLSYSRNIGIDHSSGDIIAFIDDDAIPYDNWAQEIVKTFDDDSNIGAVTGDVIPLWEHEKMSWFPKELYWMISCSYVMTPIIKKEFERGFGTNMAFKRRVFEQVGKFDVNFGINGKKWIGGEDTDMFLRVKKMNMKVMFNPSICVKHKIYASRINFLNLARRAFNGGYSVALMNKELSYSLSDSLEKKYVEHLFVKFYPRCMKSFFSKKGFEAFKQVYIVSIVILSEFFGYAYGKITP